LQASWRERQFGIELEGEKFTNLQWADNWYLLSSSFVQLQTMTRELTDAMPRRGLFWKAKSLEYMCPFLTDLPPVCLQLPFPEDEVRSPRPSEVAGAVPVLPAGPTPLLVGSFVVPRRESIVAVGTKLRANDNSAASLEHRI